ncbi:hypothetical protein JR316_0001675 [Psilocybe cubensis]|uniref:Uncharacterized protein n=2 Tax=Psilocybe cubensis TaxID=181762 RepID=A0ACB8H9T6_PSICU|nr:hypothetical protein JR316_0001675 [Psilocybe cubensis]KAH9484773.1 hypothetical protein JR316_0001675 [Psilocybe cubensis]
MFRPDPDFFDSGEPASYHQDHSFIPNFSYLSLSPQVQRQQSSGGYSGPPMSTRQNKKQRKGRNNAMNRERTVTTLTEDPNTPYLVPTPSEEPAPNLLMAPQFSGSMSGGGKMHNNIAMGPPTHTYQMQNNFGQYGFGSGSFGPMPQQHVNQPQPQPQQHSQQQQQMFSPTQKYNKPQQRVPVPDVRPKVPLPPGKNDLEILQNLKKMIIEGQHPLYKAVPAPMSLARLYKGIIPSQLQRTEQTPAERNDPDDGKLPTPTSGSNQSAGDYGDRRQRGRPQGRDRRPGPGGPGGNQQYNASQGNQGNRYSNAPAGNSAATSNLQNVKNGKNDSGPPSTILQPETRPSDVSTGGPPPPIQDGQRRGNEYPARYPDTEPATGVRPGDSRHSTIDVVGLTAGKASVYSGKDEASRPANWTGPRDMAPTHDIREYDSERTSTPRPPAVTGPANVDARSAAASDEYDRQRGEWSDRDRGYPDRGRDTRPIDNRRSSSVADQRHYGSDYGQPPVRRGTAEPPLSSDARHLSENPPVDDVRPSVEARPPPDARAAPVRANDRLGLDSEDIQSSRSSSVRPADASAPLGSVPPATSGVDTVDNSSTRPSLKDRLNAEPSRNPTETPVGADEQQQSPHAQDRSRKPNKYRGNGDSPYDEPPRKVEAPPHADEYPPHNAPGNVPGGAPRRAFVPRDGRRNASPATRGRRRAEHPAYQRPPPSSRDDPYYHSEYRDPRSSYSSAVDPDVRYEGRPYRDYSPPGSARRGPPIDLPPGPGRDYNPYPPRRDWSPQEEEEYYKSRGWDVPHDRGRFSDRDYPPPRAAGWEGRPDRDYAARDAYPPGPPPGPLPDDRYPPVRDADRARAPPPPPPPGGYGGSFNRVRPRSPSPPRRPGPGSIDDARPAVKRPREDFSGQDYYPSGGGGRDSMRRPPADYPHPPPRSSSQGPPNAGWAPPASGSSAGGGLPGDRDYRMGRDPMDYGPPPGSVYDRRSPGPPGPPGGRMPYNRGGGGYGRGGGEPRDRGGYGMPPRP